jgi:2-methylaconitate cis-trans-isomerase PrpF
MGSPDPEYGRQLNGMGGGVSSLSKICVVGSPSEETAALGAQVEYTFVQVGIKDDLMDYSGNCGNLSSMIGVFAVDEGLCRSQKPGRKFTFGDRVQLHETATIRTWNTNTSKVIDTTFPVSDSGTAILDLPQTKMAGVPGLASEITMSFENPAGARTGKLLPTGRTQDTLHNPLYPPRFRASLVDATNPTIFILRSDVDRQFHAFDRGTVKYSFQCLRALEDIRKAGAILMGLDPNKQAQPKIAMVGEPTGEDHDFTIDALSMGVPHKAVPMTVGLCAGVASRIDGTVVNEVMRKGRTGRVRIKHPGGIVEVGSDFREDASINSVSVVRTGRRLMRGEVYW